MDDDTDEYMEGDSDFTPPSSKQKEDEEREAEEEGEREGEEEEEEEEEEGEEEGGIPSFDDGPEDSETEQKQREVEREWSYGSTLLFLHTFRHTHLIASVCEHLDKDMKNLSRFLIRGGLALRRVVCSLLSSLCRRTCLPSTHLTFLTRVLKAHPHDVSEREREKMTSAFMHMAIGMRVRLVYLMCEWQLEPNTRFYSQDFLALTDPPPSLRPLAFASDSFGSLFFSLSLSPSAPFHRGYLFCESFSSDKKNARPTSWKIVCALTIDEVTEFLKTYEGYRNARDVKFVQMIERDILEPLQEEEKALEIAQKRNKRVELDMGNIIESRRTRRPPPRQTNTVYYDDKRESDSDWEEEEEEEEE